MVRKRGPADKQLVRERFMASEYIEWTPFAEAQGWNPSRSRSDYPVAHWIAEKRKILSDVAAERIRDAVFGLNSTWHLEVIRTIREYPELVGRLRRLVEDKILDLENTKDRSAISPKVLQSLASTVKVLVETAHKALLIDKWSLEQADAFVGERSESQDESSSQFQISVIGEGGTPVLLPAKDLAEILSRFYDKAS